MWGLAGEVGPAKTVPVPPAPARRRSRISGWRESRRARIAVAATGIAAAFAAVMLSPLPILLQSDYHTATGERRTVELEDGSHVVLDSGSAITVDYGRAERRVKLLAGRAWFDVARDSARPFAVAASDIRVTVTGTAFDVDLASDAVDIALERGSVRVSWPSGKGEDKRHMAPGDRLRIARADHIVSASRIPESSVAPWRRGHLLADGITVADAVRQLDRYYNGRIIVTSGSLGRSRVTGVYDVDDPVKALKLLMKPHGGHVRQITPWLLLVSED
ncbi:transmembrane sensor [Sphingobium jiangsuense]|uniref:Transmembrane sensor n=1 Tax=Sphingobium jiangsuense TaxID=870476 RepID=A0A7W6BML7_9SPHN|nr:FecR domain-containing protein [Sphingobium jiangsuense]MBB3928624.1 transmembrane sensor [Sphingobium jiangsuense]